MFLILILVLIEPLFWLSFCRVKTKEFDAFSSFLFSINKSENNSTYEEGCLSVPGQFAEIDRPASCHIKYLDYYGEPKELKARGMLATCIQHEMDHLEGILFIDYLSKLKKSMIIKKLSKQKRAIARIVVWIH